MEYIVEGEEFAHGYCYCSAEMCNCESISCPKRLDCPSECNQACPFRCDKY